MTPQEKELITQLLDRLKQAPAQPKDEEAAALIKSGMAAQPDAPYLLIQTVLIQNMALDNAQARLVELERQLAEARQAAAAKPTSFLGGLLGRDAPPQQQLAAPPPPVPPPQATPPAPGGPWGQRPLASAMPGYQQGFGQPMGGGPMGGGAGGFMRTAAAAAVGVAGGALLYQGISSMFGGHGGTAPANAAGLGGENLLGGGSSNPATPGDAGASSAASLPDAQPASAPDPQAPDPQADDQWESNDQASDWNGSDDNADWGGDGGGFDSDNGDF
ncbi:DUF2076 domain-containing protein [Vineibacter terrae]|uniref:DUF2076 domain-containing protein n=1 Tax=Vineibacter terrae TaxID=2586908 RepID=UPI002E30F727|nr:DUF2076 domain-containing protein [Vineibacter terrae]HEX2884865.1 DUF2076 domain-containing protein [Vineibacter terrae]